MNQGTRLAYEIIHFALPSHSLLFLPAEEHTTRRAVQSI
jgi:hypothetical protein